MRQLGLRAKTARGVRIIQPATLSRSPRFISQKRVLPESQRQRFTKSELREMLTEAVRNTR
jgi:hypothetical protein